MCGPISTPPQICTQSRTQTRTQTRSQTRRRIISRLAAPFLLAAALLCTTSIPAQTHKVQRPEQVLRAVGVYEWTGDLTKPTANRLVPVTVFADGELRDAGAYLARPIPFALIPGNEYELERAGVPEGMLDLGYAEHLLGASSTTAASNPHSAAQPYGDGWFGYGSFHPLTPPKKAPVLQASRTPAIITTSRDGKETAKPAATSDPDSSRPTMRRKTSDPDTATTSDTTISDPDRNSGKPDPERPTLRRRPPDDPKQKKSRSDVATVTARGSVADDPDRPRLHRGNAEDASGADRNIPKLVGLPPGLHQTSAVSDAADRPVHDFNRPWTDEAERTSVLNKMRSLAQLQLARTSPPTTTAQGPDYRAFQAPKSSPPTHSRPQTRPRTPANLAHTPALTAEDLRAYTLSYGGTPTFVYSAQTTGAPETTRFVTIVAQANTQANIQGELRPALQSVTDAKHLNQTPQMRILDVVDAEASNRASLLVELRSENSRQFALYRLLGADAEQTFLTGTTQ